MIIGITGTIGAGKGTVVERLVEKYGFAHLSVRDFLKEEITKRSLPLDRDSMRTVANDIRAQHGSDYITEQLLSRAQAVDRNVVIESIRTIGEAQYLRSHGALLWAVDAKIRIRYERIHTRGSETDAVSFEKFVADEEAELKNTDPTKQNILGVMALADISIRNDSTVEALFDAIDEALQPISLL